MTDWEQHYLEKDTPWDKGEASPGLVDYLAAHPISGRVISPGCGLGHDARVIAERHPGAEVLGLDISPSAVEAARRMQSVGLVNFKVGDLFKPSEELDGKFDWVWEHTCFCAIDPDMRSSYAESVHRLLKPGGKLLGVFYLNPYDEEHPEGTDHPPYGVELDELKQLLTKNGFQVLEAWMPAHTYPGREGKEHMLLLQRA